jgi:imidazolonepropionase
MKNRELLTHASTILTGAGIAKKDGRHPLITDLVEIKDGALVSEQGKIIWVGETDRLPKEFKDYPETNLKNKQAVIPGLIDCHTHLVFAGNRASDFARRCAGESYETIASEGGGILRTVNATREASEDELFQTAMDRLDESYRHGVRTIEIKSGYGLNWETELKVLRVIKRLSQVKTNMTIVPTFLGAHDFPKEMSREKYLQELTETMLPAVAKENLASFCDVFIDEGFYTLEEGRKLLSLAKKFGLKTKIHADELHNTESAALACEMGAHSCDHLLKVSDKGIKKLGQSSTTAVLLPGTAFYLKAAHAPARSLIEAGARVALSTDFNPGTCPTLNLPTIMTMGALYLGMNQAELFASVTYNAACALDLQKSKGSLELGKDADFSILPYPSFEELYYHFAW